MIPDTTYHQIEIVNDNNFVSDGENQSAEEELAEATTVARGLGRPKIIRTGKRCRPKKVYNTLSLICSERIKVPETEDEALSCEFAEEWWTAMKNEYNALTKNGTWELAKLPTNQKTVKNKWVFAIKTDKERNVERFKARLVAKGCSQIYGVNYTETFSPVVRYDTVRMIFAIAAEYGLYLHQMDVSTVYLNSELDKIRRNFYDTT